MSQRFENEIEIIDDDCTQTGYTQNQEEASQSLEQDTQSLLEEPNQKDAKKHSIEEGSDDDDSKIRKPNPKRMRIPSTESESDDRVENIPDDLKQCPQHGDDTYKCGEHYHIDEGHALVCNNIPWTRMFLSEAKMSRREISIRRYQLSFAREVFSLHTMLLLFHKYNYNIMEPVTTKFPLTMLSAALRQPVNFNYSCLTVCDCELLRKVILHYYGIGKCNCSEKLCINFKKIDENVHQHYKLQIEEEINCLSKEATDNFLSEHQIEPICGSCMKKRKDVLLYSKEFIQQELPLTDDSVSSYL